MGGANATFSSPDSCKFLHDRSDYKHGWQIERELEEGRYGANGESPRKPSVASGLLQLRPCLLMVDAIDMYTRNTRCLEVVSAT